MHFSRPATGLALIPLMAGLVLGIGSPAIALDADGDAPTETVIDSTSDPVPDGEDLELDAAEVEPTELAADTPDTDPYSMPLPSRLDELLRQDLTGDIARSPNAKAPTNATAKNFWPGATYSGNFADPFILPVTEDGGTTYFAFATNSHFRHLPVLKSQDLKTWTVSHYTSDLGWASRNWVNDYNPFNDNAIPSQIRSFNYQGSDVYEPERNRAIWLNADGLVSAPPSWARPVAYGLEDFREYRWWRQESWAPAIAKLNGKYVAYMSVRAKGDTSKFCISMATSQSPAGPYVTSGRQPVVCPAHLVSGVIDPEPVQYQGNWYLLWKSENSPGRAQGLHAQQLDPATGRLKSGTKPVDLLLRDGTANPWELHAIENPSMATIGGTTYLFYSSGQFWASNNAKSQYGTDYAICPKGPTAPCTRATGDNRLLASYGSVQGPGGGSVFKATDGNWKYAYHAYELNGAPTERLLRVANVYRWPSGALAIADGAKPRFADVPRHQQFYSHIMWLADQGITTGDKNGNFRPLGSTSRSDMAAFLYRYSGSPAYTPRGAEPFADVNKNTKFYKEIRWMHSQGLTTGVRNPNGGKPSYVPNAAITREAMAAFFYRMSGTRGYVPKGKEPLVDVNRTSKFYREIRWMYDNGITTGINMGGGKHRYNEYGQTNRDAFAAFLLRYDNKFGG